MQLSLTLFGRSRLRPAVEDYLATQCDGLAEATMGDYLDRAAWCYRAFGEFSEIEEITYPAIYKAIQVWGPKGHGLLQVTLRKRLVFLRAVLRHAHGMGHMEVPPPELPRLRDDGKRGKAVHTRTQYAAFRLALAPGGQHQRLADLVWWTGMHSFDLFDTRRRHIDLDYVWDGTDIRGAFWRRNHKNLKQCVPCWFPLEPEAIEPLRAILDAARPGPEALLTGRVWNVSRTLHKACDRAEVPRVSPLRLRASYSSRLLADGFSPEYVRLALGHVGEMDPETQKSRPTTLSRHYAHWTPDHVRTSPHNVTPK